MSKGIPVLDLMPGCHAERAGVRVGDFITHVDGMEINGIDDYTAAIKNRKHIMKVVVLRDGISMEFEMVIGPPVAEGQAN